MRDSQATQARFAQTRWTLVLEATSPDAREALNQLCQIYWPPVYALIRRQGFSPSNAADLAQDFFVHVVHDGALEGVAKEKGTFRSFIQKSLKNFLCNEYDRANAKKRGGGQVIVSIDAEAEEGHHSLELTSREDPALLFDQRWARAMMDEVMAKLGQNYRADGKEAEFDRLQLYLTAEPGDGVYAAISSALGKKEGALRTALHRLRRKFGQLLRIEIRHTLLNPTEQDVREEIRHLMACLGN